MDGNNLKLIVYDEECLRCHWSITIANEGFLNPVDFVIDEYNNDLDAFLKYIAEDNSDYWVGFNNIDYDWQLIQFMLDNHSKWFDKSPLEICAIIYDFSQTVIDNQNYDIKPPYREKFFDKKQIDLFRLFHFNGDAKRTSLKYVEFSADFPNLEEMNVHHGVSHLTIEEREELDGYRRNDVHATCVLLQYAKGQVDHEIYKEKDKIQLRLDLMEEFNFDHTCLSWNDVQIGDELNKKKYCQLSNIHPNKIWDLKKQRKSRTGFKFKECFPEYYKFETKEFSEFFERVGETVVNLNEKQEFLFTYNEASHTIAKGGAHSINKPTIFTPPEGYIIKYVDVSSMYPNAIRKRVIYPSHLGPKWNEAYISSIPLKNENKKLFKQTGVKKYENIAETGKLSMNGNFGRLIDRHNWQYDAFAGMCTTIGSQVDIMMLVEDLEMADMKVISVNTDSVTCIIKKEDEKKHVSICNAWEKEVGNDKSGNLEHKGIDKWVLTSVNDYILIESGEEPIEERLVFKGDFLQWYELHKNKSRRIVPIALKNYFVYGTPVEETIKNHNNIFDFLICQKASRQFHYEGVDKFTGKVNVYNKLIRYYVSTEGEKLYKRKNEESDSKAPKVRECEAGHNHQTMFNKAVILPKMSDYNICYDYYIDRCNNIISKITPQIKTLKNQLTLF